MYINQEKESTFIWSRRNLTFTAKHQEENFYSRMSNIKTFQLFRLFCLVLIFYEHQQVFKNCDIESIKCVFFVPYLQEIVK